MLRRVRLLNIGVVLVGAVVAFGAVAAMPSPASAQSGASSESAAAEDPNDKSMHERSFEETRKHMQEHSEWSKKTGKMNDN